MYTEWVLNSHEAKYKFSISYRIGWLSFLNLRETFLEQCRDLCAAFLFFGIPPKKVGKAVKTAESMYLSEKKLFSITTWFYIRMCRDNIGFLWVVTLVR